MGRSSLDRINKKVLGAWRNSGASHSWAMYAFIDGVFIETDRLTEEPYGDPPDWDSADWVHTVEKLSGDAFVVTDVYCTKDYSEDAYKDLIYSDGSFWELCNDKLVIY